MIKVCFYTFPVGHLVSDKEFDCLKRGFAKVGMELFRKDETQDYDILMVKGWSHKWDEIPHDKPVVYFSIGAEWKVRDPDNEPIKELYLNANAIVHNAGYSRQTHEKVFGRWITKAKAEEVILPAREPNLPTEYVYVPQKLRLATTCIPRPVKRVEEIERLCKKFDIELVPAYGSISDFSYYHTCDGFIHLSRKEGMPNTVLEALSYGLPCIVTNYGGAKEAVGDAGIVIKNDPEDIPWDPDNILPVDDFLFKEAIKEFKERLLELRLKVRERVLTYLNDYVTAYKFKEVFNRLL